MKAETLSITGCGRGFRRNLSLLGLKIKKESSDTDIAIIGENAAEKAAVKALMVFIPDSIVNANIISCVSAVSAVSAGMGPKATLSFSSIGDETAVLSVNREVDFFGNIICPCEIRVNFVKSLSVYENMVYGFLTHFI